jgi:hypothetical protein
MPTVSSLAKMIRPAKAAALVLAAALLAACAAAVPVAGDVAGTAVDKGSGLLQQGKVQTHQFVNIDDMIAITRHAAADLDLKQIGEEKHPDQLKLIYTDMRKQHITVTLIRRTLKATEIHVDVGLFGDFGMGDLLLRQMLHDFPESPTTSKRIPP